MNNNSLYNEPAVLRRVAAGDQPAFARLMDHYAPIVYPYLLYWLKNAVLVQETTQDIFIRLWKNRQKLPEIDNFPGYVYTIARNRASSVLSAELSGLKKESNETPEMPAADSAAHLETKELALAIETAIETLPPKRKQVFRLSREENLTYEQIAEKLQISRNTVKEHIVSALVHLRSYLKTHADTIISWLCCIWALK